MASSLQGLHWPYLKKQRTGLFQYALICGGVKSSFSAAEIHGIYLLAYRNPVRFFCFVLFVQEK
jgi:hypothetical protein